MPNSATVSLRQAVSSEILCIVVLLEMYHLHSSIYLVSRLVTLAAPNGEDFVAEIDIGAVDFSWRDSDKRAVLGVHFLYLSRIFPEFDDIPVDFGKICCRRKFWARNGIQWMPGGDIVQGFQELKDQPAAHTQ